MRPALSILILLLPLFSQPLLAAKKDKAGGTDRFWQTEALHTIHLRVTAAGRGDVVTARVAGETRTLELAPNEAKEEAFAPPRGFPYKGTFVSVVRFRSTRASRSPRGDDPRELGAFVSIRLEVEPAQRTRNR